MSRQTERQYIQVCRRLATLWSTDPSFFSHLTPTEQWHLHDYFRPSEDLSDAELLLHRDQISRERPSLPQSAGRALKQLQQYAPQRAAKKARVAAAGSGKRRGDHVTVSSVVKPQIDVDLFAKALLRAAEDMKRSDKDAA